MKRHGLPPALGLLAFAAACSGHGEHAGAPTSSSEIPELLDAPSWNGAFQAPRADDRSAEADVVELTLEASESEVELAPGRFVRLWTYNQTLPGPTIEARVGDTIRVHFTNSLPEATTIHWHGLRIPAAMDGITPVEPGGQFTYEFVAEDAGTFWYHPHVRSDEQVERGLYGAIVVRDGDEPDATTENTVVLDDLLLDESWQLARFGAEQAMVGRQGNLLLANGHASPTAELPAGGLHRLRFVNAANARYFRLAVGGRRPWLLGFDGSKLQAPQRADEVLLVPGARVDLAFEGGLDGETLTFSALSYERGHETGAAPDAALFTLRFAGDQTSVPELPAALATLPELDAPARSRTLSLGESMMGGGAHAGHGAGDAMMAPVFSINGQVFPDVEPLVGTLGSSEEWVVENTTPMDHPFHLHGFRFELVGVNGTAPDYRVLQDTINVPAEQSITLRVLLQGHPGIWMFHCHILEHAERGMMGEFEVVAP